jgi:hypothetical protein
MELHAIATGCRVTGAMVAWLRRCAEAVARACQDAHAGAPSKVEDEEERVYSYFNLDCSAASAELLVL